MEVTSAIEFFMFLLCYYLFYSFRLLSSLALSAIFSAPSIWNRAVIVILSLLNQICLTLNYKVFKMHWRFLSYRTKFNFSIRSAMPINNFLQLNFQQLQ